MRRRCPGEPSTAGIAATGRADRFPPARLPGPDRSGRRAWLGQSRRVAGARQRVLGARGRVIGSPCRRGALGFDPGPSGAGGRCIEKARSPHGIGGCRYRINSTQGAAQAFRALAAYKFAIISGFNLSLGLGVQYVSLDFASIGLGSISGVAPAGQFSIGYAF